MAINQKYSYNGYDPKTQEIIDKKAELDLLFRQRILNRKEYSAAITAMKSGWKRKSLINEPASDFNNTEIVNSTFTQSEPFTDVFPPDMIGVIFRASCNLGNCNVPPGNTVECFNKQYKMQNDGEYWVVDTQLKPIEPLSPKQYDKYGLSKDPKDLPTETMRESVIWEAEINRIKEIRKNKILAIANDPIELDKLINEGGEL